MVPFRCALSILASLICSVSAAAAPSGNSANLAKRDNGLPARVPYVFPPPGTNAIADAIRAQKNGTLLDLDGVTLNAPLFAQASNGLVSVIRRNNTIPPAMRELIILRVVTLNSASYMWLQHEPVTREVGLTTEQLRAIRLAPPFFASKGVNLTSTLGHDLEAAMIFTDWITLNVHVPDDVFDAMRPILNDEQLVEGSMTAAEYNSGSRWIVTMNVDGMMDVPVPIPS
ncbi:AhpD-like protein [Roridomyces roridus]|uniref:AhpD-like protein n=1 Tax=Roridomyces roridus TaxID=1738132 RepID=A0AAD7FN18_9AGAR|nr:AhpD-like protein [Roridomyces roridus]